MKTSTAATSTKRTRRPSKRARTEKSRAELLETLPEETPAQRAVKATVAIEGERDWTAQKVPTEALAHEFAPPSSAPANDGGLGAAQAAADKVRADAGAPTSAQPSAEEALVDGQPIVGDVLQATIAAGEQVHAGGVLGLSWLMGVELGADELSRLSTLSDRQRSILAAFAPGAAPLVGATLERYPWSGALAFFATIAGNLLQAHGVLRAMKRAQRMAHGASPRAASPATATDAPSSAPATASSTSDSSAAAPATPSGPLGAADAASSIDPKLFA